MAGAWSRASSTIQGPGGDVTGVRLDPRVETSVEAYRTLNQLLNDFIQHVRNSSNTSGHCMSVQCTAWQYWTKYEIIWRVRCPMSNIRSISDGHVSETRRPIDFVFGSRLGFLARTD